MSSFQFSKIEYDIIKKYLALKSRRLEIVNESKDERYEIFSDDKNSQSFIKKNLLKLKDCPEYSKSFMNFFLSGENLKINFYFNGLGICFYSKISIYENSFCLFFPNEFFNISEKLKKDNSRLSVVLYYGFESSGKNSVKNYLPIHCNVDKEKTNIFEKPFLDFTNSDQNSLDFKVKKWIENILIEAKKNNLELGNGLFLISAGKYLFDDKKSEFEPVQGRKKAPFVVYLDEDRIVFASEKENMLLKQDEKYKIQISFPIPGPIKSRNVNCSCRTDFVYENQEKNKICVVSSLCELKEEDKRFLNEMRKS